MRINEETYKKLITVGRILTVIGLIVSLVFISIIDFFFLVLESLDGGEEILMYLGVILFVSLLYLIPQALLFYGYKRLDKRIVSVDNELAMLCDRAKQTSKSLFHWWIAIIIISIFFMFVFQI